MKWSEAVVGDRIRFDGERMSYTIQARDRRWIIATRPFAPRKTVIYTIIDLRERRRGPDNMVFGLGYESREACEERLADLRAKRAEVSHRRDLTLGLATIRRVGGTGSASGGTK